MATSLWQTIRDFQQLEKLIFTFVTAYGSLLWRGYGHEHQSHECLFLEHLAPWLENHLKKWLPEE